MYPKGDARSPSGMAALYLWVEEPIKIKVRDVVEICLDFQKKSHLRVCQDLKSHGVWMRWIYKSNEYSEAVSRQESCDIKSPKP